MRIHLGANYQGYNEARELEQQLIGRGHEVTWHGSESYDFNDDYPLYCIRVGQAVVEDSDAAVDSIGVIVGGTGAAETISANKVNGVRAVLPASAAVIKDARQHADANVLILSAEDARDGVALIELFGSTEFLNNLDDARRVINVAEYESSGTIEGWMVEYSSGDSGLKSA